MTIEQAIENIKEHCYFANLLPQAKEALDMAVQALEQEPKKGHWIVEEWSNREHHTCSVCQIVVNYEPCYHYCPYCGAEMEVENENR